MGYIGPIRLRFDVLPVPPSSLADIDVWTAPSREPARATVPSPEPMPTPYPEPMPEPVPVPDPTPAPQPPTTGWRRRPTRPVR